VVGQAHDEDTLIELCRDADGILTHRAPMSARVIDRLERCKIISRYGIGYDSIDIDAANRNEIMVTNVPDYCTDEVSDHTIAMILMFARGIIPSAGIARSEKWTLEGLPKLQSLRGRICGLVGLGKIGLAVAAKAQALGMGVLGYSRNLNERALEGTGITPTSLETIFRQSDYISLHTPLNEATRHLINKETLAIMKSTATIINTARGGMIDEESLINALNNGALNGAGLDVLESEGAVTPTRRALVNHPKAVVTAHTAWYSEDARAALQYKTCEQVVVALKGERPYSVVNP
jgi:D-3-phosphoglycerate dehydrogenase / 2-oxoglutarate reductase